MSEPAKRGRGRPPGVKNKKRSAVPAADRDVAPDDNEKKAKAPKGPTNKPQVAKEPLTDEQQQALFFRHKRDYEKALEAKKAADAALKNAAKLIKAEGTHLSDIKVAIKLEDPEGSAELRERIERELKVARWVGAPVGTQFSLLDEIDRKPIDDRVFEDGKRSGLKGEKCEAPRTLPGPLIDKFISGWHAGQAILAARITQQREEDSKAFDDDLPEDAPANDDEAA